MAAVTCLPGSFATTAQAGQFKRWAAIKGNTVSAWGSMLSSNNLGRTCTAVCTPFCVSHVMLAGWKGRRGLLDPSSRLMPSIPIRQTRAEFHAARMREWEGCCSVDTRRLAPLHISMKKDRFLLILPPHRMAAQTSSDDEEYM